MSDLTIHSVSTSGQAAVSGQNNMTKLDQQKDRERTVNVLIWLLMGISLGAVLLTAIVAVVVLV